MYDRKEGKKKKKKKDNYYVQYLINTIKVLYTVYNVSTVIQYYISTHSSYISTILTVHLNVSTYGSNVEKRTQLSKIHTMIICTISTQNIYNSSIK